MKEKKVRAQRLRRLKRKIEKISITWFILSWGEEWIRCRLKLNMNDVARWRKFIRKILSLHNRAELFRKSRRQQLVINNTFFIFGRLKVRAWHDTYENFFKPRHLFEEIFSFMWFLIKMFSLCLTYKNVAWKHKGGNIIN